MAYPDEMRLAVRRSYVHARMSLQSAADANDVNYQTARTWKRKSQEDGDDWDKARAAARMAGGAIGDMTAEVLEDFALLFQETIGDVKDGDYTALQKAEVISRLSDAYTKTMKAAGSANPRIAKLAVAMQVIEEFANYIRKKSPQDLQRFVALLEPFGQHISKVIDNA
jgi:transposase